MDSSRPLNFRQLEAFRAVMLTGGMTAAGRMLFISQPAVTRLIRDLECELELPLFVRNGAQLAPTSEAVLLFKEVERYFSGGARVREIARVLKNTKAGYLHIGAMPNLSTRLLPKVVKRFLLRCPNVVVSVRSDTSSSLADLVAHGQLDVAFAREPHAQKRLRYSMLPSVPSVCLLPQSHPLVHKEVIGIEDIHGQDFIALGATSAQQSALNNAMLSANVRPNVRMETMHSSTALAYVSEGIGLAVVDMFAVSAGRHSNVVIRPFRPLIETHYGAIYALSSPPSKQALEFTTELVHVVRSELESLQSYMQNVD